MTTAAITYTTRQANAKALIARLTAALETHSGRAADEPNNWGFAGDLGAVETTLAELVASLGG